jgi:ATP-binding cassette subfamily B protein/subfamily B ATP-binding cassette protein MsbA
MKQPVSSKQRHRLFVTGGASPAEKDPQCKPDRAKRRQYLKQYRHWLWPYRWPIAGILLLSLGVVALDLVWPMAIKHTVNLLPDASITAAQKRASLFQMGALVISVLVIKQLMDSTRSIRTIALNSRIILRVRRTMFEKFLTLPLGELAEFKTGGILSRLIADVDAVSGLVQQAVLSPAVALIRIVLTVAILIYISWQLAVASLVLLPVLGLLSLMWTRRIRPIYRSLHEGRQIADAGVNETFSGIRVVRSFRRERREERGYAVTQDTLIRKLLRAAKFELVFEAGWGISVPATSLLIVLFGGLQYLAGKASIGDIFAFQIYAMLLLQPVWMIVSSISQTQKSLAAMERVFDVLAMAPDKPDLPDATPAPPAVNEIAFDHVTFEYRPGVPVIRDFSLTVPGGATVALVGPSGAGKTTLTDLVARFYDPTAGGIRLNGVDLRRLRLGSYRSLLAVVQQEVFVFDGTVRENIAYGRRSATEAEIESAARRANAHEFIARLPEGYDTLIGERGFKLSGGQRQRLSIARAILADPQILILDEATSNLDTESEQLIQASLTDLLKGRTTFVIAHRLSTVTHADIIVVLDGGVAVEVGRHEDLLERRGLYFDMVERQRASLNGQG